MPAYLIIMFLKVHKTPYLHRFFHYATAILGIILNACFNVSRKFVYKWFAPTWNFQNAISPLLFDGFSSNKKENKQLKSIFTMVWVQMVWDKVKKWKIVRKVNVLNECITDEGINNILQVQSSWNCVCECKGLDVLIMRLGFESQHDSFNFYLFIFFFFAFSFFLSNLFKRVLTLKIRYLLKSWSIKV